MKSMFALSQKFALLFSFAFAPRAISITRMLRKSAERRSDVNSRQIQIDSFHLPSPTVRSSSVIGIVSATKRERKRGREGGRKWRESFVQSTVQSSSTLPLFNR